MTDPDYIVSLAGDESVQARADYYNARRKSLSGARADLRRAQDWNNRERFGTGWIFRSPTQPPVATDHLVERIEMLRISLIKDREEICRLSGGTARP